MTLPVKFAMSVCPSVSKNLRIVVQLVIGGPAKFVAGYKVLLKSDKRHEDLLDFLLKRRE
jgi:hypothetical protein